MSNDPEPKLVVKSATILQIVAAPAGLMIDEWNIACGWALVEIEMAWDDDGAPTWTGREIVPFHSDGSLSFPSAFSDAYYSAHALGDTNRRDVEWAPTSRHHEDA